MMKKIYLRLSIASSLMIIAALAVLLSQTREWVVRSAERPAPQFRLVLDKDSNLHITSLRDEHVELCTAGNTLFQAFGRPVDPNAKPGKLIEGRVVSRQMFLSQISCYYIRKYTKLCLALRCRVPRKSR